MSSPPRFLMSPPDHYSAHFMFNPWLDYRQEVDRRLAAQQWEALVETLSRLGAAIEVMEPNPSSSAQVFTADGALRLRGSHFLILRNDGARGVLEPEHFARELENLGCTVEHLPAGHRLDGGNIVPIAEGSYAVGMKPGAAGKGERYLERLIGIVGSGRLDRFRLKDRRFLHLDMVLGRLGNTALLMFDEGFEDPGAARRRLAHLDKPIIAVTTEDARALACNGVTVGRTFVTNGVSTRLRSDIEQAGFEVAAIDVGEFLKAGGGVRCLTLELPAREGESP